MSIEAMTIVLNHSQARGTAKIVLMGIANHINPDNDGAWPSQARLAHYANITDRAVRDAIESLVALGELRYEVGAGSSATQYKTNRYWLTLNCPDDCDRTAGHNRVEVSNIRVEVERNQGGSLASSGWKPASAKPYIEPKEEPLVKPYAQNAFERFWDVYPRKVGKESARKVFGKISLSEREFVIMGAFNLANDPNLPPMQYVPHPATWLNRGGWNDAPYPPRQKSPEEIKAEILEKNLRQRELNRIASEERRKEDEEARKRMTPPPTCQHGISIIKCRKCLLGIN